MRRPLPQPQVTERRVMWLSAAFVLLLAAALTIFEAFVSPSDRIGSVAATGVIPAVLGVIALKLGPQMSPTTSFHAGRLFLTLSVAPIAVTVYNWRGTPIAGAMSFQYILVVLFAAAYFNRREVYEELVLIAVAAAVSLGASGVNKLSVFTWVLTMVGVTGTGWMMTGVVDRMRQLSYGDPLTGAANRRWWEITLHTAVASHEHDGEPLSIALIDIDRFKDVNDHDGHEAGDRLLIDAVKAWRSVVRTSDDIARIGGDEFAIVLPGCDHAAAVGIGEGLLRALTRVSGRTCSVGIATVRTGTDAAELVSAADRQLYVAKTAGRNRVRAAVLGAPDGSETEAVGEAPPQPAPVTLRVVGSA